LRNKNGRPKAKTAHTLNPVPFILYDNQSQGSIRIREGKHFGLSNLAATTVNLLGYDAPDMWDEGILRFE
jgi:2,3-bisphosphoglycerate-independent phosphoglycerate mutase